MQAVGQSAAENHVSHTAALWQVAGPAPCRWPTRLVDGYERAESHYCSADRARWRVAATAADEYAWATTAAVSPPQWPAAS